MEIDRDSLATEDAAPDATVSAASMFGSDSSFDLDATIANYEGERRLSSPASASVARTLLTECYP